MLAFTRDASEVNYKLQCLVRFVCFRLIPVYSVSEQIESAEIRPAEMLTTKIWDCRAGGGELQATGGSGNAEA